MPITPENTWEAVSTIRAQAPVIHNITNYVVMNSTANALLALGASPVMAHAREEVEEMVSAASALVINIGTLSPPWVESMTSAARKAAERRIPIVLDRSEQGPRHIGPDRPEAPGCGCPDDHQGQCL
jgi:hydroxyethylthiazole kinase